MIKALIKNKVYYFDRILGENTIVTTFQKKGRMITINNSNIQKIRFGNETISPKNKGLSSY
jgi:hypothetical protein